MVLIHTNRNQNVCDLGYIIRRNVALLMQVFDDELKEYDMQLVTTKCLNTAVLVMFMMLGEHALSYTRSCDIPNVHVRYSKNDKSIPQTLAFKDAIISQAETVRTLYYIMITDGKVLNIDKGDSVFPGHVCIVEKIPQQAGELARYYMYQSYITKYNLDEHIKMNNLRYLVFIHA